MCCLFKTLRYKLKKSKLLKRLLKEIDNPNTYLIVYEQFLTLFKDYKKNKYDVNEMNKKFDDYLSGKGLKRIEEIIKELSHINPDNFVLLELKNKYQVMDEKIAELQELMIRILDEFNTIKSKINKNYKMANINNNRKVIKSRSQIQVS